MLKLDIHIFFKYFLIFGWILLWGSLSFDPEKLYTIKNFEILNKNIFFIFDFLRGISTLIYSVILLLIIILFNKKVFLNLKKNFEYNFVFLLLTTVFFLQAIPYYFNNNSLSNIYFLINSMLSIIILFISFQYYERKVLKFILYLNFLFLFLICVYFGFKYLFTYLQSSYNFYSIWGNINYSFVDIPRPTGLSRSFLIIFIFLLFLKAKSKNIYILKKIGEILCVFFILMLSSRTIYFLLVMIIIANFIWPKKKNHKKILQDILYFIILPFLLIYIVTSLKLLNLEVNHNLNNQDKPFIENLRNYSDNITPEVGTDFSSGRLLDWKNIISKNESVFFGNGVMGDRMLISQSASNGILYTYASSGLLGVFIFILLSLLILFNVLKYFIFKIYETKDIVIISVFLIIVIFLRSFLETSYAVFGIDFLIFFSSFSILMKYKR